MPSRVIRFPADRTLLPTAVYLDANLLVSWHLPQHQWYRPARELMAVLSAKQASIRVSTLAIDEAWWRLLIRFYERDHGLRTWRSDLLRRDPTIPQTYQPELRKFTSDLLSFRRLRVINQTRSTALVYQALDNIRDHSLAPRDAFHLALALAIGIPNIVTNDIQFQKIDAAWLSVITFF
jgi:predicted nucleic acid-binding protein